MSFATPHLLRGLLRWWLARRRGGHDAGRGPAPLAPVARTLGAGAVRRLHLRGGDTLLVRVGGLWLTRAGDPQDHLLQPGAGFVAARSGDVVVQAFGAGGCHFEWHRLPGRRPLAQVGLQVWPKGRVQTSGAEPS